MSTLPDRQIDTTLAAPPQALEPLLSDVLPPDAARRAEEDALHRALTTNEETIESRRRGRIEAETRRVSEEVTREAQARLRASQATATATPPATTTAPSAIRPPHTGSDAVEEPVPAHSVLLPASRPIKRVLVPLDGSPYSERVLPYIWAIARMTRADITLLHVTPASGSLNMQGTLARTFGHMVAEPPAAPVLDPAGYLLAVEAELAQQTVAVESMTVSAPGAYAGMESVIEQLHPDLLVLATHARQGMEHRLLGSVADQLVRETNVPVLLIPPHAPIPEQPLPMFSRILVPVDGSSEAEQALAPVLGLAQQTGEHESLPMHIVVFYVAEDRISRRDGVRYVDELKERMLTRGLPASVDVTSAAVIGSAAGAIVGAAEHGVINLPDYPDPFDLVAMATHGRGGFERWLYGSVASYVLAHAKVPILLVHQRELDR